MVMELRCGGRGVHGDSQGTQRLRLYAEKKSLLLSVCKGNENLMRLDFFFFFPLSIRSHSTLCSTTGSLRRGTQDGRNGEAFLHKMC